MNPRYPFILFALLFSLGWLNAQAISGTITSAATGEPLPYASIYVPETGSGTVSNENGRYQIKLGPGNYTLVFQYLGYATERRQVRSGGQRLDVELQAESFDLETIEVVDGGEDVSYSVIRRAIAKADYHLNQVDRYTAQVYIKGTGRVKKVSKLVMAMVPKEDRDEIDTNRVFTSESLSNITYTRPNTFEQEVLSTYQVGDAPVDATPYLFASFYEPLVADAVSPLNPKAFGYYRFEHQGLFNDNGRFVNRIKVTPRSRGEDVFSGYLNIVEDEWAIHSLELEAYKFGFRFGINQTYAPVEDKVWMPVTTTVDVSGGILGIKLEGNYISTVSDYDVTLNPDLPGYVEVIDEKTNPDQAAVVRKENRTKGYENRLADGGELTRKELRRLMRDYEKQERESAEEPKVESNYSFKQDSAKGVRDTAFWAELRPVPLTPLEKRSYAIEDSIAIADSLVRTEEQDEDGRTVTISIGEDGTDVSTSGTKGNSRIRIFPHLDFFNPVEGYALGLRLRKSLGKLGKGKNLNLELNPRYGFSWKRGTLDGKLSYHTRKKTNRFGIELEGGRSLRQYDPDEAMDPLVNTFTTLLSHENYLSWYERAFGSFRLNVTKGPELNYYGKIGYEDRRRVSNTTDAGWLNTGEGDYDANEPIVLERFMPLTPLPDLAPAATIELGASWQPGLRYRIDNGKKEPIENSAPTLMLQYFGGVPNVGDSEADFHRIQASYQHKFEIGVRGDVSLMVRGGAFLNNEAVQLPDYRHFATSEIFYTNADPIGSYRLLPYYTYSTREHYAEFYGHYQFRKFLLSRIWKLHKAGIREDIFVNYLYTPESDHYTEVGYTIDNIFRIVRVEFVTSFQDFKYRDFGVRLSVASIFGR
ncbi:hypothetical protein CEQ90_02810 [Lewinellaceae bacterium SD302]|nr:hypothetical protein CEQ90_02810 [Lewinellaceae bacterium SD302]